MHNVLGSWPGHYCSAKQQGHGFALVLACSEANHLLHYSVLEDHQEIFQQIQQVVAEMFKV